MKLTNALLLLVAFAAAGCAVQPDPLPSWNDTAPKQAITAFVDRVSRPGSDSFVPIPERIAVFDNDGTLWSEQPLYFQALFIMDRIRALAPEHPEWETEEPFASVLRGDTAGALAGGERALLEMTIATHTGMTVTAFRQVVADWMAAARHPTTGRAYTDMVYLPMLEMLDYLRTNGFKTFIVSGGGIEFMRAWAEGVYGIPPEQVVGTRLAARYEIVDGVPEIMRLPEIEFLDDKSGKPLGINMHIGRRPILAFGNSDGDFEMLEWTTAGDGARLGVYVHHTDAEREWAYDRESHVGQLNRGLDEAGERGWVVVDMKADWSAIYP